MKFYKTMSYKIKRLIPVFGIAGATVLSGGCEKEQMEPQTRTVTEIKHDTVYTPSKSDTIYMPTDTIYLPGDTIYIPKDTIYLPSKPDTIYTPSKPDTVYLPSKPDTVYIPSKPDTIYIEKPDEPDTPPTPQPEPHHNTTYVWGINYVDNVYPATNISKSCDSLLVDTVFLKNNGVSWERCTTTFVMKYVNKVLNDVQSENKHKIRGAGTLNDVSVITEQDIQDSIKLSQMGFKFGKVYH